jgi:copper chaperone NosL
VRLWLLLAIVALSGCAQAVGPAAIDTANDTCAQCRMIISEPRFAAQIVASRDEPMLFDDIGCLREYLAGHPARTDALVFVADHRTGVWVPAPRAIYTRSRQRTPMGSGLLAHADAASREADPATAGGENVSAGAILGAGER